MGADPLSIPPIPIEDLLEHTGWVRDLARRLVGESGVAEDLVQETWLAALESPPRERKNLRGWLGRVLSNAARRRARRERQRVHVEAEPRGASASDATDPTDDLAAAAESQRLLTGLVLELEEPYRRTVLLRYWHGLDATRIAAREDVAAGTVRWRLKQGLDRLRARLDDRHGGDRAAWCAALAPLLPEEGAAVAGAAALPGLSTGVLGMKLFLAFVIGAPALLLSVLGVSRLLGGPEALHEPPPLAAARSAPAGPVTPRAPQVGVAAEGRRLPVPVAPDDGPAGEEPLAAVDGPPPPALVVGRLVDVSGSPVADGTLRVLGSEHEARAGEDGVLRLEVELRERAHTVDLVAAAPGHADRELRALATRGREVPLGDVVLAPGGELAGRVVDELGRPVAGAAVETEPASAGGGSERERRERSSRHGTWTAVRSDAQGAYRLTGVPVGSARVWALREGRLAAASGPVEVVRASSTTVPELVLEPLPREDVIAGRVLDPHGEPVAWALVELEQRSWFRSSRQTTHTDEHGLFEAFCDASGAHDVRVAREPWRPVVVEGVRPGGPFLTLRLEPARWLVVEARDAEGAPVEGVVLAAFAKDGDGLGAVVEASGEHARRVSVPGQAFTLSVSAPAHEERVLGPFDPDATPERLDVVLASVPTLRGRITSVGLDLPDVRVELLRATGERVECAGFPVRVAPDAVAEEVVAGPFAFTLREPGTYYLQATLPGEGALEHGPFAYDPRLGLDLGDLELLPGGTLEGVVHAPPGESPAGSIVAVSRGDARARTVRVGADGRYRFEHLIAGPWQVELTDRELVPGFSGWQATDLLPPLPVPSNCVVRDGEATRFDLDAGTPAACRLQGRLVIEGGSAEGWVARLFQGTTFVTPGDEPLVRTDGEGRFELGRERPDAWRLMLEGGGDFTLHGDLELVEGVVTWEAELELARLDVEGLPPSAAGGIPSLFAVREGDTWWALAPLVPDASGAARRLRVPAGRTRIVRLDLVGSDVPDPRELPALLELELEPGRENRVRLP